LGGEPVEFAIGDRVVAKAMTGGDGRAYAEYLPRMRGPVTMTVRLTDSRRVRSEPATATVFAWERRRPILLVELDALIETPQAIPLPFPGAPAVGLSGRKAVPDAAGALKRLAEFYYNLIYVAQADEHVSRETRDWLVEQGFPIGVVARPNKGPDGLARTLDELRAEGWDHMKAGVGRSVAFADTLVKQRIPVVLIPPPDRGDVPKKAQTAKDWKELRKKLQS
jgi:hypothetical protein